jgi:aspartate aminotransferase
MRKFKPSATNTVNAEMNWLRKSGIRIYNFGSGDPAVPNHPAILKEVEKAVHEEEVSLYAPVGGLLELREEAAKWMNRRYGSHFEIDETIITCGGKFALLAALEVLLDPQEEVLFALPYWPSYPDIVHLAGGVPVPIAAHEKAHWKITPEDLRRHAGKKTRVFLFNNGCNPTGALYSSEEVAALLKTAQDLDLYVISDEVYSEIVYDGAKFISCAAFAEHRSRCVIVESCSKNFAMAGYRVGFAFAASEIIKNMIAVQSQSTTGTSHLSQRAALAALRNSSEAAALVCEAMDRRRKLFFRTYNELFGTSYKATPSALYFFVKIKGTCEEILKKAHVALVPGAAFGMEGYARFAFTESEEDIVNGLNALRSFEERA